MREMTLSYFELLNSILHGISGIVRETIRVTDYKLPKAGHKMMTNTKKSPSTHPLLSCADMTMFLQ